MTQPIDITMVTWNRPEFTYLSLQSIKQNTAYPHKVIVIDNGSEKEMQQRLLDFKREGWIDTLVLLDFNRGLEYAKNIAMSFVESSFFISTDNDLIAFRYDPCWLTKLVDLMNNNPEYAAIACRPQILVGTGNIFDGKTDEIIEFSHVPGYLRIMRTDLTRQIGAWDEKRPMRGHEEIWSSERFRAMGYRVGWANYVECWHLFGNENDWGYTGLTPNQHGHNEVSSLPHDDWDIIKNKANITKWENALEQI